MKNKKSPALKALALMLAVAAAAALAIFAAGCSMTDQTVSGKASGSISDTDTAASRSDADIIASLRNHEDVLNPNYESDYYIVVYTLNCSVLVLGKNDNGRYTEQVKAFICSPGADETPTEPGVYDICEKLEWRFMMDVYGHYCTRIGWGTGYLFHSVPYREEGKLSTQSSGNFEKLGTRASHGCVRLCTRDAKWIYDNIPLGTQVHIIDDKYGPAGEPIPKPQRLDENHFDPKYAFWDPTDPSERNPYNKYPPEHVEYITNDPDAPAESGADGDY